MKKIIYFTIPLILFLIFILVRKQHINHMIYLEDININELTKCKISSVNDIEKFNEISNLLPGNISRTGGGLV